MIAHKHIDRIVWIALAAAVLFCIGAMLLAPRLAEKYGAGVRMEYEERIFDHEAPVVIDIQMDGAAWQNVLDTASREMYSVCDVVINGTRFRDVGIRPKGNTSLSSIAANPNTDRYSFKLEFDQYVDGQTAWGLDKLCLNNNYADATNMKEALIYDMYQYLGADASLYNVAEVYVNGEYWGVYLALEAVEDSFLLRNYGVTRGELYKPDSMGVSFGDEDRDFGFGSDEPENTPEPTPAPTPEPTPAPDTPSDEASGEASGSFEFPDLSGGFGPFGGRGGQNLNYTDDDLDSYSTIWKCEVTKTDDSDHRRVVEALKHISAKEDLDTYMDVDNLLRLMAVHNFSVNGDSLSGGMAHNYYLYENGSGRLNILPWDYNLALGGMGMGGSDAKSVVNEPIDDSWQSTSFFDGLLEDPQYSERYHEYYRQLVEGYIFGGGLDEFYTRTRGQIDGLVATDPNALYDYDEFDAAAQTLYYLARLRGESVLHQLNGTIPSTSAGQRRDSSMLVEADDIDLSVMGSMSLGGSFGGGGGFPGGFNPFSREPSGEASEEATDSEEPSAEAAASGSDASPEPENAASPEPESDGEEAASRRAGGGSFIASGEMQRASNARALWILAACAAVLAAGVVFAACFKKKG